MSKEDRFKYNIGLKSCDKCEYYLRCKECVGSHYREEIPKLNKRIAELEEQLKNAIVPKFKVGQDVFVFDWNSQLRSGRIYEIQTNVVLYDQQPLITYLVDFYSAYEDDDKENDYYEEKDVFITKEEAESKLKELRGE